MPSKKGHRKSAKKDTKHGRLKIGYHPGTGQYRKYIKGKTYYFGSDPETALARYAFFLETGLVFKTQVPGPKGRKLLLRQRLSAVWDCRCVV